MQKSLNVKVSNGNLKSLTQTKTRLIKERCKLIWHVLQEWIFHVKSALVISLTYYTVSVRQLLKILKSKRISRYRVKDLTTDDELGRIREVADSGYKVEGDLRREQTKIKRLMEISSYRGSSPSWLTSSWSKLKQRTYS